MFQLALIMDFFQQVAAWYWLKAMQKAPINLSTCTKQSLVTTALYVMGDSSCNSGNLHDDMQIHIHISVGLLTGLLNFSWWWICFLKNAIDCGSQFSRSFRLAFLALVQSHIGIFVCLPQALQVANCRKLFKMIRIHVVDFQTKGIGIGIVTHMTIWDRPRQSGVGYRRTQVPSLHWFSFDLHFNC